MDAKSKARFINSVLPEKDIICPKCGKSNESDCRFCVYCGAEIIVLDKINSETKNDSPAFGYKKTDITPINEVKNKDSAFVNAKKNIPSAKISKYVEPNNVFAHGLPSWSLTPPQVMVRRH